MRATIDAASLRELADWGARFAPVKPNAPILGAVHLAVTADTLTATVTDWDTFGRATTAVVADTETTLAVSARLLQRVAEAVADRGNGRVDLALAGSELRVSRGKLDAALPLMHADDFPTWPVRQPARHRAVNGGLLARVLEHAAAIADNDREMVELDRVQLASHPDGLTVTATDAYRVVSATLPWSEAPDFRYHATVYLPGRAAKQLGVTLRDAERVMLGFPEEGEDNSLLIGTPYRTALSRLAATDRFPDIGAWTGKVTAERTVTVDKADLLGLVKRTATLAAINGEDKSRHLRCDISGGSLRLTALGEGRIADDVEADTDGAWDGDPWPFAANAAFLAQTLAAIPAPRVSFAFSGARKPIGVGPAEDSAPDYPTTAILMPIRITAEMERVA